MDNNALVQRLKGISNLFLIVGVVGLVVAFAGLYLTWGSNQFFQSYLVGYVFWLQVSVGCMFILMVHHLAGGPWGAVVQRILESAAMVFPILGLLIIPLLISFLIGTNPNNVLYEWALPEVVEGDELLEFKQPYLNVPFFIVRTIIYFAIWSVMAYYLNKWSLELDKTGELETKQWLGNLSGPGLVLFGITVSFASFDWMMSIEPHWFSTMYGFMFATGAGIAAFGFIIVVTWFIIGSKPFADVIKVRHINDYALFLFGAVMTWGYAHLCQGLIIWSGDVAEFTTWYIARTTHGWDNVYLFLVIFQFAVPFFLLLFTPMKRNINLLMPIALIALVARVVDIFFMVAPAHVFHHEGIPALPWMDVVSLIGVGGIWLFAFTRVLASKPSLIPLKDPNVQIVQENIAHGTQAAPSHA